METCKYNLTELPEGVVVLTEENRPDKSVLKWSGVFPIPSIGTAVKVTMNKLGPGVVESYFFEHGYLGVCVKLSDAPEWHRKQSAGTQWPHSALVFGQEIKIEASAFPAYLATAKVHGGLFAVTEILTEFGERHQIGGCRDFTTFEEADDVARRMAAGEFPDIRPAGRYISNR